MSVIPVNTKLLRLKTFQRGDIIRVNSVCFTNKTSKLNCI